MNKFSKNSGSGIVTLSKDNLQRAKMKLTVIARISRSVLLGLGSLFDANQLAHISKGDTAMETRVGEAILIRSLENLLNSVNQDLENCEPRSLAIISALATVIKVILCLFPIMVCRGVAGLFVGEAIFAPQIFIKALL